MLFRVLTLFLFFALPAYAEQEVDINNIPPEILNNLSPEQISQINNIDLDSSTEQEIETSDPRESLMEKGEKQLVVPPEYRKFGFDYFSKIPTTIAPTQDLPVPLDYKVSLRDTLTVLLTGSKNVRYKLGVNLDGTIQFPELGSISVVNRTLEEVNNELSNLISASYVGVEIDVNISKLSSKKITIVGAVNIPGVYLVNPFSTLSNVLAYAGGVKDYASLRQINLIKPNGDVHVFDLYDLLIYGDRSNDLTVDAGDTILIKGTSKFVSVQGEVVRPATYEYLDNESVSNIIDFALGLTGLANPNSISTTKINSEKLTLVTESIDINETILLGDIVSLRAFPLGINTQLDVLVQGPIKNSGFYKTSEYTYLKELINNLEFTDSIYPYIALIEQYSNDDKTLKQSLFSLNDPGTFENIKLMPNDKILFFSKNDFLTGPLALMPNFGQQSKDLFRSYITTLEVNKTDAPKEEYKLPIYGKYRVLDLMNYFGVVYDQIDENNILLSNSSEISKTIKIDELIESFRNQSIKIFEESKLFISGATVSGNFKLNEKIILHQLIDNLSFGDNIYPFASVVEKFDPISQKRSSELFSLIDISTQEIEIDNNSKIFFLSNGNFRDYRDLNLEPRSKQKISEFSLSINYKDGLITVPTYGNFRLRSIIDYLGLDTTGIEQGSTTYIKPVESQTTVSAIDNLMIDKVKFHSVTIRFTISDLINVVVKGRANLPGVYTLESGTTIAELYEIFDGFKENAFQDGIILKRDSIRKTQIAALEQAKKELREAYIMNMQSGDNQLNPSLISSLIDVNINQENLGRIVGDFSTESRLIDNFQLYDGDEITIPSFNNTVTVLGEVLNPNTVVFDRRLSYRDYIRNAGGFKQNALKNDAYIIKANGSIEVVGRNIFLRTYSIGPGDVIVVPRDLTIYKGISEEILSLSTLISNLAFGAASLNALQNN